MSLPSLARRRSVFPAWSNPVAWWWALLVVASGANIAAWLWLYRTLEAPAPGGVTDVELMLFLSAGYVSGCAFRSFLPRADVERICLFDTWLSSVTLGRSVATVAELCFAAQWAIILRRLGVMTGSDAALVAATAIVPVIAIAEGFSWHGVLTKNYLSNAIENSLWAVSFLIVGIALACMMPAFAGLAGVVLLVAIAGIAGYLLFLAIVDVPMYLTRWKSQRVPHDRLRPRDGLWDASVRWVVTHDSAKWKDEIAWMSLYFTVAVWSSLALCVCYAYAGDLPH